MIKWCIRGSNSCLGFYHILKRSIWSHPVNWKSSPSSQRWTLIQVQKIPESNHFLPCVLFLAVCKMEEREKRMREKCEKRERERKKEDSTVKIGHHPFVVWFHPPFSLTYPYLGMQCRHEQIISAERQVLKEIFLSWLQHFCILYFRN